MTEMTQPSSIAKELSSGHADRLIRVLIPHPTCGDFYASTFHESEIRSVDAMGHDRSALVLRSGIAIPVALPYEELETKIYQPDLKNDGPVLDLRGVTGDAAKPKAANAKEAPAEPKILRHSREMNHLCSRKVTHQIAWGG